MDIKKEIVDKLQGMDTKELMGLLHTAQQTSPHEDFTCMDLVLILKDTLRKINTASKDDNTYQKYLPVIIVMLNNARDLCTKAAASGQKIDEWVYMTSIIREIETKLDNIASCLDSGDLKDIATSRLTKTPNENISPLTPACLLKLDRCYGAILSVGKPVTDIDINTAAAAPNLTTVKLTGDYIDTVELIISIQMINELISKYKNQLQGTTALKEMELALSTVKQIYNIDDKTLIKTRKNS